MTKILVIEDQDVLREELLDILDLEQFQTLSAENGRMGLELARQAQPDLILCDVTMPEMDGHEVLAALRQDPLTATIPFIFLTAKTDKADIRQGMQLGADDYLFKPFSRLELLEAIATQFRKQEAVDRKIQQKLERLRSSISLSLPHELHTPLAAIMGMSELLIDDYEAISANDGIEMLETIHSSAERLYRLTQNFLLYAELELLMVDTNRVAALRHQSSSTESQSTITDMALLKAQKAERSLDLTLDLTEATVKISELKLRKIIEEIIDNAFKFSEAGTPVSVTSRTSGNHLTVYIRDRGRGMTEEQITSVGAYMQFERKMYEQQGSGLGLAIAKRLTELYGGELVITSVPGGVTTVSATFPIEES